MVFVTLLLYCKSEKGHTQAQAVVYNVFLMVMPRLEIYDADVLNFF